MGALFYKESHGAFIVFDLSNRQSFLDLPSWVATLTDVLGENVIIVLLGNCCDKQQREVKYNEAADFARANNFAYLETSAKTGFNIAEAFSCLTKEVYASTHMMAEEEEDQQVQAKDRQQQNQPGSTRQSRHRGGRTIEDQESKICLHNPKGGKGKRKKKGCCK